MSIDDKIRVLLKLVLKLNGVIRKENTLLKQQASQDSLRDIVEQKQSLLQSYEQQVKFIEDNTDLVNADTRLCQHLLDETDSFSILINENKLRLKAKIESTKRIFAIIQDAAKEYKSSVSTYSESGTTSNVSQQPFQPAVSVGLNQEL